MNNSCLIKSFPNGIVLHLNSEKPFADLLIDIAEKFSESRAFFKDAKMALAIKGRTLTEEEEIQVIMKEIKQTKETLEMTPADRTDIIEECNRRLTVLEAYAPKMMGEDEIKAIIEGVLSELGIENPTGKDKGNIMKHLMPKVKGKADGKLVNDLVSTYFK